MVLERLRFPFALGSLALVALVLILAVFVPWEEAAQRGQSESKDRLLL